MKYLTLFLLITLCTAPRMNRWFLKANDSFCPRQVLPNWSRCPQHTTPDLKTPSILDQPFIYLTKGKQSFVFVSADRQWVLKFPRLPRYIKRFSWKGSVSSLPRFSKTLAACELAYRELQKETGIIYAHLKPTSSLQKSLLLVDQLGNVHTFAADDFPFVIQRFGAPFFSVFDQSKNPKQLIQKTLVLFSNLYTKGVIDRDPILDKNFGIVDETPFILDIGRLEKASDLPPLPIYLRKMTQSLEEKLLREAPHLHSYYLRECLQPSFTTPL